MTNLFSNIDKIVFILFSFSSAFFFQFEACIFITFMLNMFLFEGNIYLFFLCEPITNAGLVQGKNGKVVYKYFLQM